MRPKKPRFIDGIQLADNLYPDNKKRPGHYRYKREDGTFKGFTAATTEEANELAIDANSMRGKVTPTAKSEPLRNQLAYHVPQYIDYQQRINPELKKKRSWDNRIYAFNQFAKAQPHLSRITHDSIRSWWDELSHSQQKLRMAAFRSMFNWLMGQGLCPRLEYNPFTTADDKPRLLLKSKPKKQRRPVTQADYRAIHKKAGELGYPALQIAMEISRYTTMREGDICKLQWPQIVEGELRVVVSKSEAQKGSARATRHKWTLDHHPILKQTIDRARELSLKNKRCPFIVSHTPKRRVWNEEKEHICQVTGDRLSRMFAEARDACGIEGNCFHEIRGLSSTLYKSAGYSNDQIKDLMAHESVATTIGYQNAEDLPYEEVGLRLGQ